MHRSASYAVGDVDTGECGEQVFACLAALVSIPLLKTTPPPKACAWKLLALLPPVFGTHGSLIHQSQ